MLSIGVTHTCCAVGNSANWTAAMRNPMKMRRAVARRKKRRRSSTPRRSAEVNCVAFCFLHLCEILLSPKYGW